MPRWVSADSPPEDVADSLVVIPGCSEASVPANWIETAEAAGARVVRHFQRREHRLRLIDAGIRCELQPPHEAAPLLK